MAGAGVGEIPEKLPRRVGGSVKKPTSRETVKIRNAVRTALRSQPGRRWLQVDGSGGRSFEVKIHHDPGMAPGLILVRNLSGGIVCTANCEEA